MQNYNNKKTIESRVEQKAAVNMQAIRYGRQQRYFFLLYLIRMEVIMYRGTDTRTST